MSLAEFTQRFAPDLAHLVPAFDELDPVICGCTAGPQKPDDPDQRQSFSVCIDNPWGEEHWVTVYSASHCVWFDSGEEWHLSLADLLAYMRQLPKPLHSFSKFQP